VFPCGDVVHDSYIIPRLEVEPEKIRLMMISEAAPTDPNDYYDARGTPLFQETTLQAFCDIGIEAGSIREVVQPSIYFTTAVKCGKRGYGIKAGAINECSHLLEKELSLFPNLEVSMMMKDVAIKSLNRIAKRMGEKRVIPAGSTYKIRHGRYLFRGKRLFPSYLQAGPAFLVEKSKRKMIAEDVAGAMKPLS
jgi:hypothetical protein